MRDQNERDAVLRQIEALMNMTTERGCTEHEAANAASAVQTLLIKYGLKMEELRFENKEKAKIEDKWGTSHQVKIKGRSFKWGLDVAHGVAKVCFVDLFRWSPYSCSVRWIGEEHDVQVANQMFDWIIEQAVTRCKYVWATEKKTTFAHLSYLPFENAFLAGYGSMMWSKLYALAKEVQKAEEVAGLVVHKGAAVEEYMKEKFPHLYAKVEETTNLTKKGKPRKQRERKIRYTNHDETAYMAGAAQAKETSPTKLGEIE